MTKAAHDRASFAVLRTPLMPFDEIYEMCTQSREREHLRQRLRAWLGRAEVREAIFLASPSLEKRLDVWRTDPDSPRGRRAEAPLVRYFLRMAGRATPFGLFSGCAVVTCGHQTRLELAGTSQAARHTRLDMDYLWALAQSLRDEPALRGCLRYHPSSSLYRVGDRWRYVESRIGTNGRSYHLVAVTATDHLDATIERARLGATREELAAALVDGDIACEAANEFVDELVRHQLLVADSTPQVTGSEPVHHLAAALGSALPPALTSATRELAAIDREGLGAHPDRYRAIAERLRDLPAPVDATKLFQVDLVKAAPRAQLGEPVMEEIARGVEALRRLAPARAQTPLTRFGEAFVERYGDAEVPLVEALDDELGIGFDRASGAGETSSLLRGLSLRGDPAPARAWGKREDHLLRRLQPIVAGHQTILDLDDRDIDRMATSAPRELPDAYCVMATVAARSDEDVDRGDFRVVLHFAGGPSGANLLGRFCHADAGLRGHVLSHLRGEEAAQPEVVFAEIAHLPEGRLGNVLCRPVLRDYEIDYLGHSGVAADRRIAVTDLTVSVRGSEIVLRSRRLGKRIVPRLTTAHNYDDRKNLVLYRFLCALQQQGVEGGLMWSWGPLATAPFLPRVVYGKTVLSRATWRLRAEELSERSGEALRRWRDQRSVAEWVCAVEGDHELVLQFDNPLCTDTLLDLLRSREEIVLRELYPGPQELLARGPEGRFVHELLIPYLRGAAPPLATMASQRPAACHGVVRSFPPGSEWLYTKIYTGRAMADEVLRSVVSPLLLRARDEGLVDRWFFVRYNDPDWQLRVRFRGAPARLWSELLPALERALDPMVRDGRVWRWQLDTYQREIHRYGGGAGIAVAEELFDADSDAALGIVSAYGGDDGLDARWRLALVGVDRLLGDVGLDLAAKRNVAAALRSGFAAEIGIDAAARQRLGARFRRERASLDALFHDPPERRLAEGMELLRERSRRLARLGPSLSHLPLHFVAPSYVHMHVNRVLRGAHREHELVLYDFLERLYESQLVRGRARGHAEAGAPRMQDQAALGPAEGVPA